MGRRTLRCPQNLTVGRREVGQGAVVDAGSHMVERLAGGRHAETAQIGEAGQAEPAGFMRLTKDHLLLFAVNGPP